MTTLLEVCKEANDILLGSMREQIVQLNGSLTDSAATVVVDASILEGIQPGDLFQVDTELMRVMAWTDHDTNTVLRGYNSTAAAHADNAVVTVNPIVPLYRWVRHINNELRSLSSPTAGLYRVEPVEVTYNSATLGYNLLGVDDLHSVIDVFALQPGGHGDWVALRRSDWDLQRDMATGDFPSSYAIRLLGRHPYPGQRVRVLYRTVFGMLSDFTDIVESDAGLPATAIDLLAIGAVIRAVESDEIARNKLETNPIRKLGNVPAGAITSSLAGLRNRYDERRSEERSRMIGRYGL